MIHYNVDGISLCGKVNLKKRLSIVQADVTCRKCIDTLADIIYLTSER